MTKKQDDLDVSESEETMVSVDMLHKRSRKAGYIIHTNRKMTSMPLSIPVSVTLCFDSSTSYDIDAYVVASSINVCFSIKDNSVIYIHITGTIYRGP